MNGGQPESDYAVGPERQKNDQAEHRLSAYCDMLLDRILLEPCWFSAQDHSGKAIGRDDDKEVQRQAQMNWRARQKKMGIKPAQLDWRIYQAPLYAEIELKRPGRGPAPSAAQETTMRLLRDRSIATGWTRSVRGFYDLLCAAGFRLHPNAANIVAEITERHAAAEREAAVKRAAPRKRAAPKRAGPRYTWASHP